MPTCSIVRLFLVSGCQVRVGRWKPKAEGGRSKIEDRRSKVEGGRSKVMVDDGAIMTNMNMSGECQTFVSSPVHTASGIMGGL